MTSNLSIIAFKFKHLQDLIDLHVSQSSPTANHLSMKTLPKIGYVVYLGKTPIASGFLRRVEGNVALIDTLVSNGHFGSRIRHQAISLVVDTLLNEAKRLKLDGILAHTKDAGVLSRAQALGFHIVPETLIGLALGKL